MNLGSDAVDGQEQRTIGASSSHLARGGELPKTLTGIRGLDEITRGGLPRGRPTLVCGGPGSGKTLLALTFLVNGALHFDEPGVLMTFEENEEEIASDVASLGFDLPELIKAQKLAVDYVRVERSEIEETGEYDLEGLFVRLDHAIRTVGARRVVLDTIESLFAGLKNDTILRSELRRLFRWLKERGVTALITGERGDGALTRQGLEEYVSDAVILLDHRVHDQVSTRRLRVVKYRGSHHGTNEYPFLIDADGISVLPVSSLALRHEAPLGRVSSGVAHLDLILSGEGYYRGSTILVSGTAGTGKTSLAAHFLDAACRRGERCLCFLFEESPQQLLRSTCSATIRSRSSISWKTHSSRAATKSSPYRRSCDGCRSRRSSATSRTRNACWSGWISVYASDRLMPVNRRNLRASFEQAGHPPQGERYMLRPYVTGMTSRSSRAVSSLKAICEEYLEGR